MNDEIKITENEKERFEYVSQIRSYVPDCDETKARIWFHSWNSSTNY